MTQPSLADDRIATPEEALHTAQKLTHAAMGTLGDGLRDLADSSRPLIDSVGAQAGRLAQRGVDALHDGGKRLQDQALHASDRTVDYIREEPVRAMLIAAATGAALMALVSALHRPRDRH